MGTRCYITKVGSINLEVAGGLKWKRHSDHIHKRWGTDFEKGDNLSPFLWTHPKFLNHLMLSFQLDPRYPSAHACHPPNCWAPMVNVTLVGESVVTCSNNVSPRTVEPSMTFVII